ncbi:mechanosensitive ion channel family protein, partial [Rhizobiaceae sp. 2RAB30]
MNEDTTVTDVASVISSLQQVGDRFVAGINARFAALNGLPVELANLRASLASAGTSLLLLLLQVALTVVLVAGVLVLAKRRLQKANFASGTRRRFFAGLAAAMMALVVGFITARLLS